LRTLIVCALVVALVGCSRQPPPQAATDSCVGNPLACRTAVDLPIELVSLKSDSETPQGKATNTRKSNEQSLAHRGDRLAKKRTTTTLAANTKSRTSRNRIVQSPIPDAQLQHADGRATLNSKFIPAGDENSRSTVGLARSPTPNIEQQLAAATANAERMTAADTATDAKTTEGEKPKHPVATAPDNADRATPQTSADALVAVLMARPDIQSISDLTGKILAIDEKYSGSSGSVRTAVVAAGAPEVQLSAGPTTALNRLVGGEVPGAVVALVSNNAAEAFPDLAGYKIYRIPLSPRALRTRR
jgi:hypothetical protein